MSLSSAEESAGSQDDSSDEGSSCQAEMKYASVRVLKTVAASSPVGAEHILKVSRND